MVDSAQVVFCDDIRQEVSGKFILVGVYVGEIIAHQAPSNLQVSTWITFQGLKLGLHSIAVEVEFHSAEEVVRLGEIKGDLQIDDERLPAVIAPTGLVLRVERSGQLNAYVSIEGAERQLAGSIYVKLASQE